MCNIEEKMSLVSVAVITYNSSKYVLETLDSIKEQTYQNIELIVSDDCSTDNTVELCRNWIEHNNDRFVRTEILTVEKNTGVAGNLNRAEVSCRGEWVKGIAGDDILMPNCVQDCMDYVKEHPDAIWLFGRCEAFGTNDKRCKEIDAIFDYSFFSKTKEEQLHQLIFKGNCVPATTAFYHRERIKAIGVKNDERIPFIEDWPKWINLINAGVHFEFIDKIIVRYRVSESSLSTTSERPLTFRQSKALLYKLYQFKYEYRLGKKKQAVENWLRAQYTIKQNKIWYFLFKLYKILIMKKLH